MPTLTTHPCVSCLDEKPVQVCYCDRDVCADCEKAHLALCAYAQQYRFKTPPVAERRRHV